LEVLILIGDNIKFYRKKNQLTQDDIAEACNVTRQAVSKWENGKTQPDIQTLSMLASTLEVSEEDLIYGPSDSEKKTLTKIKENTTVEKTVDVGATVGTALAVVLSYVKWKSIGWAILHGCLGWVYIIYYAIRYGM
jgi:transcriptional regulator with XRE-family HTH domain